ncbi:MAG: cation diffusion facilitator family transporter [Ignavibacteriae bacterium]|nr:cation diffusion facilitator family transporter [Ignavibacteriota bacterium]
MPPHIDVGYVEDPHGEKSRIALTSVFAAIFITGLKLVVGIETNSLGLLSEAAHSGLDFLAALVTFVAVKIAARPPDKEHQYGHGKIENLSAFIETLLLVITCGWIIYEAVSRLLTGGSHVESSIWGYIVIGVAILVDISRSRALKKVAVKYKSQALEADALHFSSDVWSSLVVLAGLVFVSMGYVWLDALAALIVAFLVLFVSYRLGRRTVDALMDKVPDGLYEQVVAAVQSVDGVEDVRNIRIRPSGAKIFVDTTVAIRRTTPFQKAHAIMDAVEHAINERHPGIDVVVHAEPFESSDESVADKVRMIVIGRGLRPPHNLVVHHQEGRYHVEFDVEYTAGVSFVDAHAIADELEEAIFRQVQHVAHVTVHLEEYLPGQSEVAPTAADDALRTSVGQFVAQQQDVVGGTVTQILRNEEQQCTVHLSCIFPHTLSLAEVHRIVSQLESRLYERYPEITKVSIHAEPDKV